MTRQDTKPKPERAVRSRRSMKPRPQPQPKQESKPNYCPVNFPPHHLAPYNKGKTYDSEPFKSDSDVDNNALALDPKLMTLPLPDLVQDLDRLVKQEPTGKFFDDDKNTLTQTIQLLSKCPDLPDLDAIPGFRRHRQIHSAEYAESSLMGRPLSVLVPVFIYYTQAKGIENIDESAVNALRELFVRRIMTIRLSPNLKKRIIYNGKVHFQEDIWETFPNDDYYRNGTYNRNGKRYYHLFVYNEHSDYEDESDDE